MVSASSFIFDQALKPSWWRPRVDTCTATVAQKKKSAMVGGVFEVMSTHGSHHPSKLCTYLFSQEPTEDYVQRCIFIFYFT